MTVSMLRCWNQVIGRNMLISPAISHHFSTKSYPYMVNVGIPEFLKAIGNGVEAHIEKLDKEIGSFQKLLVTRTLRLKKLDIPCKHRKLILRYASHYRLGLWRPRSVHEKTSA